MKIGIIGPSENEIMPFIEQMSDKKVINSAMLTFHSGKHESSEVIALYCGVCKVNAAIAAQILIDKFEVTHIIVTGVAGAIDNRLKIGDTVISTEIAYHDVAEGILTEYHPWMESVYFKSDNELLELCREIASKNTFPQKIFFGRIVTGEAFISDKGRSEIKEKYNPLCVDMETASIAHVCYVNKIPFMAIRSITDTEDKSGTEVFEENCVHASLNSIDVVKKLLELLAKIY